MKRYKNSSNKNDGEDKEKDEKYSDGFEDEEENEYDEEDEDEDELDEDELKELKELGLGNIFSDEEDDIENSFIDARQIFKQSDDYPLCSFFLETRRNAPKKSTLSWLSTCDTDTINMMIEISEKIKKINEQEDNPIALDNDKKEDIFDRQNEKPEDLEEEVTDESDFCGLCVLLYSWENDCLEVPMKVIEDLQIQLSVYVNAESMRREKMVKIKGNGLLCKSDVVYTFTAKGEKISASLIEQMGLIDDFKNTSIKETKEIKEIKDLKKDLKDLKELNIKISKDLKNSKKKK